mmetsp:Transcript_19761/g.22752  ORF Transcript_19761/g.22752 Transcript_19761/m.22752 type:complete len:101 (+) Transcript_19761:6-308(+)
MTHRTVSPSATARSLSSCIRCMAVTESRPAVGSSRISRGGAESNARAMLTRLRCPPEMPCCVADPTITSRTCSSPTRRSTSVTRASRSSAVRYANSSSAA